MSLTVAQAAATTGTTLSVRGLSQQIVDQMLDMIPGVLEPISDLNVKQSPVCFGYLQPNCHDSFGKVIADVGRPCPVVHCLRVLPMQWLLRAWYLRGLEDTKRARAKNPKAPRVIVNGITLAARPSNSDHENATATDTEGGGGNIWRPAYARRGNWRWAGSADPGHHSYEGPARNDVSKIGVRAFQILHNRYRGSVVRLREDGDFGPATEAALKAAPAGGWTAAVVPAPAVIPLRLTIDGVDVTQSARPELQEDGHTHLQGPLVDWADELGWDTTYDELENTVMVRTR